ncbi:MAG: hypothetical protein QGH83_00735, partial [Candidatus Pacebacteria bacterium]|nr:hypothetical protein [Candidatus Paceibacterota bacterium]
VIGTSSNLYIEQISETQFDLSSQTTAIVDWDNEAQQDEIIIGMTSGMQARVAKFTASPLHAANNLLSYADIDKTTGDFLEYFRRDFMPFIDRDVLANKRLLQKHIQDLYLSKGTNESYEFLFRILYGLEAEISYPSENVIRSSESEFVEPSVMRLYSNKDLKVYSGGTVNKIVDGTVVSKVYINDIYGISGTNDGDDAYEAELVIPFRGTFSAEDTVTISDRDGLRPDVSATVRGIMTDIDITESSIYLGLEDNKANDLDDIIRLENPEHINIEAEIGTVLADNIITESNDNLVLQYTVGSEFHDITFIELEDGTETGIASGGKLLIDAIDIASDGSTVGGAVYDGDGNLIEDNAFILNNPGYPVIYGGLDDNPELDSRTTTAGTFHMGGGLYEEQASLGALYSESDTFNYNSPRGGIMSNEGWTGTASQSLNTIKSIGRGEVTDIVIDNPGTSYSDGDPVIFVNTGTDGLHAEAEIAVTDGLIEIERGTPKGGDSSHDSYQSTYPQEDQNVYTFTGDGSNKVFSGVSNENLKLDFDPNTVEVFVGGTELTRETQFTSDQAGQKITIAAGTAAPGNTVIVEIHKEFQGILLEDALSPPVIIRNKITGLPEKDPITGEVLFKEVKSYIQDESSGAIRNIKITEPGVNYKNTPQVYVGGTMYYDPSTLVLPTVGGAAVPFDVGEVVQDADGKTMAVASHNIDKNRVTVYKRHTDPAGKPRSTIRNSANTKSFTIRTTTAVTKTVNGSVSSSNTVVLDDTENVWFGQTVTGTGISGIVTVTGVHENLVNASQTTLSAPVTPYPAGTGYVGSAVNNSASVTLSQVDATVVAGLGVTGTGISGTVTVSNINVNTGALTLSSAQTLAAGTELVFKHASYGTEAQQTPVNTPLSQPFAITLSSAQTIADNTLLSFSNVENNVTAGEDAKLWAFGDRIGSIKKLGMQIVGHDFKEPGVGNYEQHAVIKTPSATLAVDTTVTASGSGSSGVIAKGLDGSRNILTLKNVKGMFRDGDYCTTSDNKNFVIGKTSLATARGKLGGTALLDGNYTNDKGFPSVTSQRIHDSFYYQDFSYLIKVGNSINNYRSLVKSLLSPAGTIFFGEVAVRMSFDQVEELAKYGVTPKEDHPNWVENGPFSGSIAEIYNKNFDGLSISRSFIPTLIIGSRMDTADIALEDGMVPTGVMEIEQVGSTGSGAVAGVYTFEPIVSESLNSGLEFTIQIDSGTTYSNLVITDRGGGYSENDNIHITREMVGGSGNNVPAHVFASFKVTKVGDSLETSNEFTFTGDLGNVELETGEGIMTTERFLAVTSTTVRDQASGILYTTVPGQPPGAQSYIVGETFTPQDRDFFNRQLIAELSPKGHRVHKELDIFPTYNQHKIYYTTLSNALAVGTKVRGATSNALGIVIKHDTTRNNAILKYTTAATGTGVAGTYYNVSGTSSASGSSATFDITLDTTTSVSSVLIRNTGSGFVPNETITIPISAVHPTSTSTSTFATITVSKVDSDYIIIHRDQEDWGKAGSQFSGTEIIQNILTNGLSNTNYFTATDIELHWVPEDIIIKREPSTIAPDTNIPSTAQKVAAQGGGETYDHSQDPHGNPSVAGFTGRGKTLVAGDHSEAYDSEMKQRKVTMISSPLYTSGQQFYIVDETDGDNLISEDYGDFNILLEAQTLETGSGMLLHEDGHSPVLGETFSLVSGSFKSENDTQRGTVLSGFNHTRKPLTQRSTESYVAGDRASTRRTTTIVNGDIVQPYLAINGTALRLDDIRNSVSELPGDSSVTVLQSAPSLGARDGNTRVGVNISSGVNWGYRPAGQKLFETTNYLSENLISEACEKFIMEEEVGNIEVSSYPGDKGGSLLNEGNDGGVISFSDDTVALASGTLSNGTYTAVAHTGTDGSGLGMTVTMVIASNATTSLTIVNPGQGYMVGDTVTFTNQNSQTNSLVLTIATIEVATVMLYERGLTHQDENHYFVSEESTQIGSYNLISESGERIIDESGNRFLSEEALMIGRKESNQSGPTIGDLGNIMFTENYGIMNKIREENIYILVETDSGGHTAGDTDNQDNMIMEDGTFVVSESEDIMLETGEHMLQESLSEGLRIGDISSIYPNRLVSNLERELGRRTNFIHSAVVQTG